MEGSGVTRFRDGGGGERRRSDKKEKKKEGGEKGSLAFGSLPSHLRIRIWKE